MPLKPLDLPGIDRPPGNHFGILSNSGRIDAFPPGMTFAIDDEKVGHPVFLQFKGASLKALTFVLLDQTGKPTTEYQYRLQNAKPLTREAVKRIKKNRSET